MGMTIDEAIYCMKSYLPNDDYTHCTECKYYGCKDNKTCKSSEAHQKAMEIMRKYQKIVGIVSLNDEEFKQCGLKELKEILEVIADGRT
jgi:hypothetical protein